MPDAPLRLYTFALSHYAEKARWGLDRAGLPYEEVRLMPGLHLAWMRWHRLPRTWVPVLDTELGMVQGSGPILDWLQDRVPGLLADPDPVAARDEEARIDLEIGRALRQVLYYRVLRPPGLLEELWGAGARRRDRLFLRAASPLLRRGLAKKYRLNAKAVAEAEPILEAGWLRVEARLADAEWLSGARFGRADLAVAALLGPLVCPPEHPFAWPERTPEVEAFAARYRGRPLWRHVERCYREERGTRRGPPSEARRPTSGERQPGPDQA